ncbi:Pas43 [Actinoplanes phage phiAsp2]|uniref:Pas43 n=1 Tax=Actinoplanes phage phiAsp2 TaxID=279303 RepID=Q6J7Y8_9CAUD|nr:Pas43 [Actinoplanes phage phiAsp2]AAT36791.1 Pas43 [Actinoplanes phage phiAsp2]
MNNASETQTPTATEIEIVKHHTGSTVVALIERVWEAIRADHPELPAVVVTTGSGEGVKWGHFRPESWKLADDGTKLHEFFLASEALAKGATQVLQTTIHEAAHTLSRVRGIKDTSRQGRWHNAAFKKAAEELGLEHKASQADKSHGFSFVTLTQATKDKYADLLAELERELKLTGLLPFWLGGSDEEDQGGEKITGKPKKTEGEDGEGATKSGNLKATCSCEEPIIIRLSRKVLDLGVVRCDSCSELFTAA